MEQAVASVNEQTDSVIKKPLKERLLDYHVRATPEEEEKFFKDHKFIAEVKGNKIYLDESRMSSQEEIDDMFFMETFHNLDKVDPELYNKLFTASENDPSMQAWKERSYKYVKENNNEKRNMEEWWKESYFDQLLMGYVFGGDDSNIPTLRENFSQGVNDQRFGTIFKKEADNFYKLLGFKKGGTVMKLAMGGTPGVAKGDDLKDPSLSKLDPETVKEKVIKADIEDKVSSVAKRPQSSNTNIQTAMLLNPEEVLKKYEQPIMANKGAMPVTEKEFTPSDYFKTEMMKQWLFAEGSTGDKDGQETNQAFKGIHIDSYPELAEEIRQGTLTDEKVAEIMYRQYTGQNVSDGKPSKFRDLSQLEDVSPEAAKLLFMDAGYTGQNAGAIKDLQKYLKVKEDGLLGEDTLGAMNDFDAEEYRKYLGTLDRYSGEKGSKVYNRFFTEEERQQLGLYEKELTAMAKGGSIDIQKFMEGGLADNADDTPGATESEVADDIPAMISEGELVVPANVVRYHGLSKYENMRKTALKALDELEDNGQIRPVDSDGTPIVKDVKKQTDEVMASKGATVARYNEGGSPTIEKDFKTTLPIIGRPVDPDLTKDLKPVGPRVTTREEQTITPDDSGNKATLTTPENKNYRVTSPDTKITATGPRTTKVIGSDDVGGVDFDGIQFGKKRTPVTVSGPSTGEKLLSGITTVAALDKLFNDGKITESVYNWSKENIFDPIGEFLGFDKAATAIKTGPLAGSSIVNGQLTLADGTMDIVTSLGGADTVGKAIADGTVISANSYLQGIPANAEIITRYGTGLSDASHYAVFKDADGATQTVQVTNAQKAQLEAGNSIGGSVVSNDGLFSWKGGLATIGTALSLYDLIENGPSVANVAGTAAGVGGMVSANVFGLAGTAFGKSALGSGLAAVATPLAFVALAAGLVEAFSGPPTNAVAEAGINFDNPEYKESDILIGGFTGSKFSQDNTDAVTQLSASIGSYVSSMEQALEINIGGELFLDVGSTRGLRYGYVDGYDELGMYKYHKKDLDYELLHGQGQTGKGYLGEDAVTNLMNDIQDDTNVVVMFALADKAAGGNGYATYDNLPLYRQKISTLKTYRPGMAGSGAKAVLTDQERNILDGFQKKEFAEVTGDELAALMPIYDKIAPVQQQNSFNFNSLAM